MKILIGCEESGRVRDAFKRLGHDAWSCDILATRRAGNHLQCDIFEALKICHWDAFFGFPPCTHLCVSGARWFKFKRAEQLAAIKFFLALWECPIEKIALENPIGIMSRHLRKPDQIIQPWQFGHGETKATCLWLKNLPPLTPTKIVSGREQRIWKLPPSPDRARLRSETFQGIADAMAQQWGNL